MALGATARTVVAEVVGDALGIVAVGLGMGAVACWFLARLMTPLLFGVAATDAVTMLVAGAVLLLVAVLASVVPAARAAAVSPVVAFRGD